MPEQATPGTSKLGASTEENLNKNRVLPDPESIHQAFEDYLTRLGLRQTKQRRVILDAVLSLGSHVDAETISREARSIDDSIGLATVYRSLQLLIGAGIIAERKFDKDRAHFELIDPASQHHDHFICTQCGKIVEFLDPELEALQDRIAQRLGFRLTDHRMDLYGDCEGRCGFAPS
jgi:Fur family ferric uptake transcriptional regulator